MFIHAIIEPLLLFIRLNLLKYYHFQLILMVLIYFLLVFLILLYLLYINSNLYSRFLHLGISYFLILDSSVRLFVKNLPFLMGLLLFRFGIRKVFYMQYLFGHFYKNLYNLTKLKLATISKRIKSLIIKQQSISFIFIYINIILMRIKL